MNIGLITYEHSHLQTLQLAKEYLKRKYNVFLIAFPFHLKNKKKFKRCSDRPNQLLKKKWKNISIYKKVKIKFMKDWKKKNIFEFLQFERKNKIKFYIICISKIIPNYYLQNRTFLNAHPGLLPQNRGVDAFKRSILNCWPVGVTLHIINSKIDSGIILKRKRITINNKDNYKTICKKNYLSEIQLLSKFSRYLKYKKKNWKISNKYRLSHKRIIENLDKRINKIFLKNRSILIKASKDLNIHQHRSDSIVKN